MDHFARIQATCRFVRSSCSCFRLIKNARDGNACVVISVTGMLLVRPYANSRLHDTATVFMHYATLAQANELSGSDVSVVTSPGASVTVDRLVAQHAQLRTQGGPLRIRTLYGEHVQLHSGRCKSFRCLG
jgi:hypothetical protein